MKTALLFASAFYLLSSLPVQANTAAQEVTSGFDSGHFRTSPVLVSNFGIPLVAKSQPAPVVQAPPVVAPSSDGLPLEYPNTQAILFPLNKADLSTQARDELKSLSKWMKNNPSAKVKVEGHTDPLGSEAYNYKLGEQRAASIQNYLKSQGVSDAKIQATSRGEAQPVAEQDELNRRAEIQISE